LLGPSGCGKSTVLNLVAGLEAVSSGEIYFDERRVSHLSPKARDVAMVFQSYALYPHKTVFDNIAFPLQLQKRPAPEIDREVNKVADLLGVSGILGKKPAHISGGERQRVALGRALIRQPVVFLMDEPLSNLDAHLRTQTRSEIKRLHARLKTTTLYVTHDQEEALVLSNRIAVLKDGIIQQIGTPPDIYFRPANIFVAEFIGAPRINLMDARVDTGERPVLNLGPVQIPMTEDFPPGAVRVGVRPEDVRLSMKPGDPAFVAEVLGIEAIGSRTWVELRWGPHQIRAAAPDDLQQSTGQVAFEIIPERLHVFDAVSGRRLP
jgi:multiple sugar transport system ATP-binding protein